MKRRQREKAQKKGRVGRGLFLLVLIGIGVAALFLLRQEISDFIKPQPEKIGSKVERKGILLFFSDSDGEYLRGEKRKILKRDMLEEEAKEAIVELIKGPKGDLIPTLPPRTKLLSLQINEKGVAKVNFDQTLSKDHPGGSTAEIMTLYSIVNSLSLNFPEIKRVQILMDGRPVETIAGHLSLKDPVLPRTDLIKRQ